MRFLAHDTSVKPLSRALAAECRFEPVIHLESGDIIGATAVHLVEFEEQVSFGPRTALRSDASPAQWTARQLEAAAKSAGSSCDIARPIHISAPAMALADPETPAECEAVISKSSFCAQEFVIEAPDAAFHTERSTRLSCVETLRKRGFRVAMDARSSLETPLCDNLKLMLDSIRVCADAVLASPALQEVVEDAAAAGVAIIAQGARYQDGVTFARYGVAYGSKVRTDA